MEVIQSNFVLYKISHWQQQEILNTPATSLCLNIFPSKNNQRSSEVVQKGQTKMIHTDEDEKPEYGNKLMKN